MGAPGALTKIARWWTKIIGLAFGFGLSRNLTDAYSFLMNVWEPEDRLFVFGFSRGAYTARAFCSLLHMFGLIRKGNDILIAYAIQILKRRDENDWKIAEGFRMTYSRECKPYFVGVWDTAGPSAG
jgi:uncharacterized protein (DUF2235 family)